MYGDMAIAIYYNNIDDWVQEEKQIAADIEEEELYFKSLLEYLETSMPIDSDDWGNEHESK